MSEQEFLKLQMQMISGILEGRTGRDVKTEEYERIQEVAERLRAAKEDLVIV